MGLDVGLETTELLDEVATFRSIFVSLVLPALYTKPPGNKPLRNVRILLAGIRLFANLMTCCILECFHRAFNTGPEVNCRIFAGESNGRAVISVQRPNREEAACD